MQLLKPLVLDLIIYSVRKQLENGAVTQKMLVTRPFILPNFIEIYQFIKFFEICDMVSANFVIL